MNIKLKISTYQNKNNLSNIYFNLIDTNYRKKIKSDLYINRTNYTKNKVQGGDPNHISKNILLEKLKKQRVLAIDNFKLGKWQLSDCENYLKKGVEIKSIIDFIKENFENISIFTKNDYLNTVGVYRKHLKIERTIYLRDLNTENLNTFKTNTLFNGLKISSINSYLKKLKVIVNKAHSKNLIINKNIFSENLIEKGCPKKIKEKEITLTTIEEGIFKAESIYEIQAIAFFITMIMFKGMKPIEMVKYKQLNIANKTNEKDKYVTYNSKGVKKYIKFSESTFKLIRVLKISLHFTHFEKSPEMLAPYNNEYEVFNQSVSEKIKRHKNLWNIYQKKIKKLIGCNYTMANTIYINYINNLEVSHKAREILIGNKYGGNVIFDLKNPLRDQINNTENKLIQDFQLGKLVALIENKMNLLGIVNSENKNTKWKRPIDFIKIISDS